jgi:hypothetical protein
MQEGSSWDQRKINWQVIENRGVEVENNCGK